jgi:hypothetical protein
MHLLEPAFLIVVVFSVGGLVAALAAAVVTVDMLANAGTTVNPRQEAVSQRVAGM